LFAEKRDKMAQHHKKNLEMDLFQEQEETQEHFSYKPTLHADEIGLTSDKYVPLNASVDSLPLVISYSPMTTARWLLMEHMEHTLSQALGGAGAGFSAKDTDDVRRLVSSVLIHSLRLLLILGFPPILSRLLVFA
jgi:hypothetical protein